MAGDLRQHAPTARRLSQLRQAGIFPHSRVLSAATVFAVAVLLIAALGDVLLDILQQPFLEWLSQASAVGPTAALPLTGGLRIGLALAGLLVIVWLAAMGIAALQRWGAPGAQAVGMTPFAAGKLGFHRPHGADLAWELLMLAVILAGGAIIIYAQLPALVQVSGIEPAAVAGVIRQVIWAFAWRFGLLMVGLGLCDYLYQRAIFGQAAAMTHSELQQEVRETEGPWLVRWWRQQRMRSR